MDFTTDDGVSNVNPNMLIEDRRANDRFRETHASTSESSYNPNYIFEFSESERLAYIAERSR